MLAIRTRLALLVASMLIVGCQPAIDPAGEGSSTNSAHVLEVTDGDSIRLVLDGVETRVRLLGVNAPEEDECMGSMSRDSLADLLEAPGLRVESEEDDQYGRLLAYLFTEDGSINVAQVERGMAIAVSDGGRLTSALFAAEEEARSLQAGWWEPTACGGDRGVQAEIHLQQADPPGPDADNLDLEIVTITSEEGVDLSGFVLRDESTANRLVFPPGTRIDQGETLTITSGCGPLDWCRDSPIWNNGGDAAILLTPDGAIVAIDRYLP